MKISIIGATHAGTFATMQILKDHPDYDVTFLKETTTSHSFHAESHYGWAITLQTRIKCSIQVRKSLKKSGRT